MSQIQLRAMQSYDCIEISRLQCESFRWGAAREGFTEKQIADYCNLRGSVEALEQQLHEQNCLIAEYEHKIVGVIGWDKNLIIKLYVLPKFIGKSIGKQLFGQVVASLRQEIYKSVEVVTIFPKTISFYEKMGMTEINREMIEHGFLKGVERVTMAMVL